MQSTEAGLCGRKLQSAPEIVAGDDAEHILYCPECAARLRLVGDTPNGLSLGFSPAVTSRQTLADFPPEPQRPASEVSAISPENSVTVASASLDTIDVTVDDDEPTRILNATEGSAAASVDVEIPTPEEATIQSAPVEPFVAPDASIAVTEARVAAEATIIIAEDPVVPEATVIVAEDPVVPEVTVTVQTAHFDSEPTSRAAVSDAPFAKDVMMAPARSTSSRYRRVGFGAAAALVALTAGLALRHQPESASTHAAGTVERLSSATDTSVPQAHTVVEAVKREANALSERTIDATASARPSVKTVTHPVVTNANPVVPEPNTDAVSGETDDAVPNEPKEAVFDAESAATALDDAATRASSCRQASDPSGVAIVTLTFAPSGRVTTATLAGPPFVGTATGSCIASMMRSAKVPAFSGPRKTVKKTVTIQ